MCVCGGGGDVELGGGPFDCKRMLGMHTRTRIRRNQASTDNLNVRNIYTAIYKVYCSGRYLLLVTRNASPLLRTIIAGLIVSARTPTRTHTQVFTGNRKQFSWKLIGLRPIIIDAYTHYIRRNGNSMLTPICVCDNSRRICVKIILGD